ncbi:uncharacterized protein LOC141617052 [Silene latifolia]|uniref:uncharacterized protein LOC141617052 n=1 Tax=Silene latifolia TaxID=37657 RepID=UPI003D7756CD
MDSPKSVLDVNQKRPRETISRLELKKRKHNRKQLLLTVPSYTLATGAKSLRYENRVRLRYLLRRLVLQHNWVEASGVLSVLLKATCKERAPLHPDRVLRSDRFKYSVAMELRRHMGSDPKTFSSKIEDLYRTWILKIRSYKNRPSKDRYILLDYIVSSFARNEHSVANDALKSLKQTSDLGRDPLAYLVIGLASYEFWYSGLLEEIKQRNLDDVCKPLHLEGVDSTSFGLLDDMREEDADSINESCSDLNDHSEVSVVNDNGAHSNFGQKPDEKSSKAYTNLRVEHRHQIKIQAVSENTIETIEENDDSMEDRDDQFHCSTSFNFEGLQSLLPFRMPFPDDMAYLPSYKDYYDDAVKYLKLALQSPPPVSEASLLPLVQLLLLGGQVNEALLVIEQFCYGSNSALPYRLRARLQECTEAKDPDKISLCFEGVIKKDPTCRRSLTRLMDLHQRGYYAPDRLVEVISLHLEATYGDVISWREFASCLLKISNCIEDRASVCMKVEEVENDQRHSTRFSRMPAMFVEGVSKKTWKLRCKWWLNRHFSKHVLTSETKKGDWEIMSYKAACASHLYGRDFDYVVKVHAFTKEHNKTVLSFLQTHMENSLGFFSYLTKKKLL